MNGDSGEGFSSAELLRLAHDRGYHEVTGRQLETWRHQRLLPRPARAGQAGLRPLWLSPPGTERQLLRLCELRSQTRDASLLRITLWLEGFEQDLPDVRAALHTVLTDAQRAIDRQLEVIVRQRRLDGDPGVVRLQALALLAEQVAAARGRNPIVPRLASARGHRRPGLHALLHVMIYGEAPPLGVGSAENVDRVLGLAPRARHDRVNKVGPWMTSPTDLDHLGRVASLPALHTAVGVASDEDLLYARRAVAPLTNGLALVSRMLRALYHNQFAGFSRLRHRQATSAAAFVVALVLSLRNSDLSSNLTALVDAVEEAQQQFRFAVERLRATPATALQQRLAGMAPGARQQLKRLIALDPRATTIARTDG